MFKRLLVFVLMAGVAVSLGCKKKPPSRDETRGALREAALIVHGDIFDAEYGELLACSNTQLGEIPLFGGGGFSQPGAGGGKEECFRSLVATFNSSGPWDTLVGRWRWTADSFGLGSWSHYATTPTDSMIFEWSWEDSSRVSHDAVLTVYNWSWDVVDTFDVLTKVHAHLRSDGATFFRLDLNQVEYGAEISDIRKVDVSLVIGKTRFVLEFGYVPPTANATLRMELSNGGVWYEVGVAVRDEVAPLGDGTVVKAGSYKDSESWTVNITLADPDAENIQLVDGEVKHKGTLAATVKSEKRYENEYPYLYVWLEYADGTTEGLEELFSGIGPE